jgi:sec-independent protein translocase protein TatA
MPFNLGVPELVIIMVIIMLVFGVGKLPEIGGALGRGIREFKEASSDHPAPKPQKVEAAIAEPQPAAAPKTCPACGTENLAGNKFCGSCGKELA